MAKQAPTSEPSEREGASYPYYTLRKCLWLGKAVKDYGGARSEVPKTVIAQQLQMGESSSSISQLLTSAKAFNIIEGHRSYTLTENGKRYFFPTSETDQREAELEFFGTPTAFRLLIDRFDGDQVPSTTMIANILLRDAGVAKSWAPRAASLFISSANDLGVIDGSGFLRYKATQHTGAVSLTDRTTRIAPIGSSISGLAVGGHSLSEGSSRFTRTTFGTSNEGETQHKSPIGDALDRATATIPRANVWVFSEEGGTVRLETPDPLPRALWARLRKYVQMLSPDEPEKVEGDGDEETRKRSEE